MAVNRRVGVGDLRIGARARRYLHEVVRSNRVSHGPFSEKFEALFARLHGCRFGAFMNSGTSALHVALAALKEKHGWKDGDEVIVPSVTFVATSNVVLHNGLTPVFADVDPLTYNIDPAQIERRLTRKTRAVIPVHLLGLPADMGPIMDLARRKSLSVVEDSCETVFAKYRGKPVGSFGEAACFSTYVAHYIVTGVGGVATTNDPDLAVRMRSIMNHGRDSIYLDIDDGRGAKGRKLWRLVDRRFKFVSLGHSFRATEFEAALGLAQLEERAGIVAKRRKIAARLTEGLKPLQHRLQLPFTPADREHLFMLYPIVARGEDKTALVHHLESHGVETRDLLPLLNQPVYRKLFGDLEPEYPVARMLNRSAFYIGCHQYMTAADVDHVCAVIRRFYQ
jgi:dTDP-4-amino-4,6-dideoxygalactose transaminase